MQGQTPHVPRRTIIFIVGPTAVGKSGIGLRVAQRSHGEIISCDAMQVYREIAIVSDKPSPEALKSVRHHCVDLVSVTEEFDVARFRKEALKAIEDIQARGKTPVIVGGSGMYMAVLLDGIFEGGIKDEALRAQLTQEAQAKGAAALHAKLTGLDPVAAAKIHPHDPQRLIRALEVVLSTGKPISRLQQERDGLWGKAPIKIFALNRPREELYRRVEARVEAMFSRGLVEEVRRANALPLSATAKALIGIAQVSGYLKGEYDLARAKYLMKRDTRHYAKRQLTWFRRDERLQWIEIGQGDTSESLARRISGQDRGD